MITAKQLTLGSLFDGIGGFPLAGKYAGIRPVWASEIEPFPIRVTEKRLPEMKHYGDIHTLHGARLEPVDVITFGSPCQDVSVAGRREGLSGGRSGLFFEAIRIIREMREATNGEYPRWAVWENVPGALSSHDGEDYRQVLESLVRIKDPEADVPLPAGGRWLPAGEIMGDGYSLAWRILDAAQGWGVAQRRRRIFAVLDLDGQRAGEVLFESEGVSGYTPPRIQARQGTAGGAAQGAGETGVCLNDQGGARMNVTQEVSLTLRSEARHPPCILGASGFCTEPSANSRSIGCQKEESPTLRAGAIPGVAIAFDSTDSRIRIKEDGICQTLCSRMEKGGNCVPLTLKIRSGCEGGGKGALIQRDLSATLGCANDQTLFEPFKNRDDGVNQTHCSPMGTGGNCVSLPFCKGMRPHSSDEAQKWKEAEVANTLTTIDHGEQRCSELMVKVYGISSDQSNAMLSDNPHSGVYEAQTCRTLDCNGGSAACNQGGMVVVEPTYSVRPMVNTEVQQEKTPSLMAGDYKDPIIINVPAYALDRACFTSGENAQYTMNIREDVAPTLVAEGPSAVAEKEQAYLVRRLTPLECCRLQGFPDGWTEDLGTEEPSEQEIAKWVRVFEDRYRAQGKATRASPGRVIKWLKDPHNDAAQYKAYGNSVAVPCVFFVLAGIVWAEERGDET